MKSRALLKKRIAKIATLIGFSITLVFQFNNCGKISSQIESSSNETSTVATPTNNGPVEPSNPYVLTCLASSDGVKVANSLLNSIKQSTSGANKISSLDWDQSIDLVVTLDNECVLRTDFSDPIMNYLDHGKVNTRFAKSIYVVKKEDVKNLDLFIKNAIDSECLMSADKNYTISLKAVGADTFFNSQVHLFSSSANSVAINASKTTLDRILTYVNDPTYAANNKKVKIAVIDTGVDTTNPDLVDVIARDSNNKTIILGANTTSEPALGFTKDSGFHGTHVSGLIGAQYNNSMGVSGVYGRNVEIYPLRTSNDGESMTLASIVTAIQTAIAFKVDIINLSLGTTDDFTDFRNAINDALAAGITVVAAAGNEGIILGSGGTTYPAMYSTTSNAVITVGSLDLASKTISGFSNRSSTYVDILAPGSNGGTGILSTIPLSKNIAEGQTIGPGYGSSLIVPGGFQLIQGTSMAAPIVTGALASVISMAKSRNKVLTNLKLKEWIKGSGSPKNTNFNTFAIGGSYLDLSNLSTYAMSNIANLANSSNPTTGSSENFSIITHPVNKQAVVGEKVDLVVTASGTGSVTYQWYRNNLAINGATGSSLNLTNIQTANAGVYKVRVTQGALVLVSNNADVKVGLSYCK